MTTIPNSFQRILYLTQFINTPEKTTKFVEKIINKLNKDEVIKEKARAELAQLFESTDNDIKTISASTRKLIRINATALTFLVILKKFKPQTQIKEVMNLNIIPISSLVSFMPIVALVIKTLLKPLKVCSGIHDSHFINAVSAYLVSQSTAPYLSEKIKLYLSFYSLYYTGQGLLTSQGFNYDKLSIPYQGKNIIMMGLLTNIYQNFRSGQSSLPDFATKLIKSLESGLGFNQVISETTTLTDNVSGSFVQIIRLSKSHATLKAFLLKVLLKWVKLTAVTLIIKLVLKLYQEFKTEFTSFKDLQVYDLVIDSIKTSSLLTSCLALNSAIQTQNEKLKTFLLSSMLLPLINQSEFVKSYVWKTVLLTSFTKLINKSKNSNSTLEEVVKWSVTVLITLGGIIDDEGLKKLRGSFMG